MNIKKRGRPILCKHNKIYRIKISKKFDETKCKIIHSICQNEKCKRELRYCGFCEIWHDRTNFRRDCKNT